MKPVISISIPDPCSEKWENFSPAGNGGFCSSCTKVVVDLTRLSDAELLHYLQNRSGKCCGKLRVSQLKNYHAQQELRRRRPFTFLKAGFISAVMLFFSKESLAQVDSEKALKEVVRNSDVTESTTEIDEIRVYGVVTDESDHPLPGINVILKGKTIGTSTDSNGSFTFPAPVKEGDVLVFSFIGFEQKEYIIRRSAGSNLQITLDMEEVQMMGEVSISGNLYVEEKSSFRKLWCKVKGVFRS